MKWFRMYCEAVDDEKLRLLAFEDRWHYVAILCLKSAGIIDDTADTRERKIAVKLGLTQREADEVRRRLFEVGLIGEDWQPLAWAKRQYKHDDSYDRVKKYRERQSQQSDETARNDDVTVSVTDSDNRVQIQNTDTEREKKRGRRRAAHSTPFPENFSVTTEMEQWAEEKHPRVDLPAATEEFRDKSLAKGYTNLDWVSAWRVWIGKAEAWGPHKEELSTDKWLREMKANGH